MVRSSLVASPDGTTPMLMFIIRRLGVMLLTAFALTFIVF